MRGWRVGKGSWMEGKGNERLVGGEGMLDGRERNSSKNGPNLKHSS